MARGPAAPRAAPEMGDLSESRSARQLTRGWSTRAIAAYCSPYVSFGCYTGRWVDLRPPRFERWPAFEKPRRRACIFEVRYCAIREAIRAATLCTRPTSCSDAAGANRAFVRPYSLRGGLRALANTASKARRDAQHYCLHSPQRSASTLRSTCKGKKCRPPSTTSRRPR